MQLSPLGVYSVATAWRTPSCGGHHLAHLTAPVMKDTHLCPHRHLAPANLLTYPACSSAPPVSFNTFN